MTKPHIKPIGTHHYRLVVVHPTKPTFVIEDARTGVISQPYHERAVYQIFKDAHRKQSALFNHLCKKEMEKHT